MNQPYFKTFIWAGTFSSGRNVIFFPSIYERANSDQEMLWTFSSVHPRSCTYLDSEQELES